MNRSSDEKEKVIGRTSELDKLLKENSDKYHNLYQTKDIYLVAFFITRGLDWYGYEQRELTKTFIKEGEAHTSKTKWIYFFFENSNRQCEPLAMQFRNPNRSNMNTNAMSFYQSWQTVRSITTDPRLPKIDPGEGSAS